MIQNNIVVRSIDGRSVKRYIRLILLGILGIGIGLVFYRQVFEVPDRLASIEQRVEMARNLADGNSFYLFEIKNELEFLQKELKGENHDEGQQGYQYLPGNPY